MLSGMANFLRLLMHTNSNRNKMSKRKVIPKQRVRSEKIYRAFNCSAKEKLVFFLIENKNKNDREFSQIINRDIYRLLINIYKERNVSPPCEFTKIYLDKEITSEILEDFLAGHIRVFNRPEKILELVGIVDNYIDEGRVVYAIFNKEFVNL